MPLSSVPVKPQLLGLRSLNIAPRASIKAFMDYGLQNEFHDSFLDDPMQLFSSSDDDSDDEVIRRGSRAGCFGNIERGRESAALRLHNVNFAPTLTYTAQHFLRRFRISQSLST